MKLAFLAAAICLCSATAQDSQTPKFEVATVKLAKDGGGKGGLNILPGGGLRMEGVTLRNLIAFAYGVPEERITGLPNWANSTPYSIAGKPEHPDPADIGKTLFAPGTPGWNRVLLRTRALLADRFELAIHKDSKESSGYALVLAKGGSKLVESKEQGNAGTMRSFGRIDARRGTMEMLSAVLTNMLHRPVEDRTGLTGGYDYKLEYEQDGPPDPNAEFSNPSIFSALQEQLGLRLDSAKVSSVTIVVDRVSKPSEN